MSKFGVSSTAEGAAFCRAVEQYLPESERLFNDPLIYGLMSSFYHILLNSPKLRSYVIASTNAWVKGLYGEEVCRTRFIDEAAARALDQGIDQVVILGARFDTRAYLLPGMKSAHVFEVDMARTQKIKKGRLEKILGRLPENVSFVPIDFDEQDLSEVLSGYGFDRNRPALFIWEAVTQYLQPEAAAATFSFIGGCVKGRQVIFTYVLKWIIEHPETDPEALKLMRFAKMKLAPFVFGLAPDQMPAYLSQFHLKVIEDAGKEEYEKRYLQLIGRVLDVTYRERICIADVNAK